MVDARLAEDQTDGWHYEGMARDGQTWRDSLAALDEDAMVPDAHPNQDPLRKDTP